jgi:hypothetical protein
MNLLKKHLQTKNYCLIALTGHAPTHAPHSIQVLSSTCALPSESKEIAVTGQTPVQAPQPIHVSLLIFAFAIKIPHSFRIIQTFFMLFNKMKG